MTFGARALHIILVIVIFVKIGSGKVVFFSCWQNKLRSCVYRKSVWHFEGKGRSGKGQLKCNGTRAETRFRLSAKRTSQFKSAGASVQSTTGSRGMRITGINAGYTMFRGSVKGTGYPLHSPVSPSLPLPVPHRVPSHFNWSLQSACQVA